MSVHLSICPSMSVCPSVHLSICPSKPSLREVLRYQPKYLCVLINNKFALGIHYESFMNTFAGVVKAVYKQQSDNSFVVLKSLAANGGECLVRCSTIAHLETIQRKSDLNDG